ncbi:hypothetical protein ACS0PU_001911 [Formica fusca]
MVHILYCTFLGMRIDPSIYVYLLFPVEIFNRNLKKEKDFVITCACEFKLENSTRKERVFATPLPHPGTYRMDKFVARIGRSRVLTINFIAHALIVRINIKLLILATRYNYITTFRDSYYDQRDSHK